MNNIERLRIKDNLFRQSKGSVARKVELFDLPNGESADTVYLFLDTYFREAEALSKEARMEADPMYRERILKAEKLRKELMPEVMPDQDALKSETNGTFKFEFKFAKNGRPRIYQLGMGLKKDGNVRFVSISDEGVARGSTICGSIGELDQKYIDYMDELLTRNFKRKEGLLFNPPELKIPDGRVVD